MAFLRRRRRSGDDDAPKLRAYEVRSDRKRALIGIALTTFIAWIVSFILFYLFTDSLSHQLERHGFAFVLIGWIITSALIVGGYLLGYALVRSVTPGDKMVAERDVPKLAFGDAFASACGGFAIAFVPVTTADDPFLLMAWVMVVGCLFGFAQLNPAYLANWREVAQHRFGSSH